MIRLSILLLFSLLACTSSPEPATHFYDWNKELNRLSSSPLSVKKTVILDGTAEVIDSVQVDLAKEWALFREADLNKPAYALSYENHSAPGLIHYVLKKGEDLPVRSFQIALDSAGRPSSVDFEISSENLIYITSKKLSMHLVSGRVVSYTISGSQALRWFSSPTRYSVSGVVL
ncbi:hypothetical protein EWU20_00185 [Aquirufa antheringensis]|uniref:Lipoprotein n=1 Tax=Aquirufa antheringensis TaxID=2516559 RepID=A0A4Q9BFK1_9BACT|nr:hypothetical protein [Aquirufa antheringensis]TBH75022.1 hypothetical protein EWU20_00185 [Aquirufa antheringensis]